MTIQEFKEHLEKLSALRFVQTDGEQIPSHFQITEAGLTSKHFIDCGGTTRNEKYASFQLWVAQDVEHRLTPKKLVKIVDIGEGTFNYDDMELEVEYQADTVGRYGLDFDGDSFHLYPKQTDCLAKETCRIPEKKKESLSELQSTESSCCG